MSASIQYLLLDSDYDPVFDASASLTGTYAVAQAIDTRLKLFLGEWWENRNLGLPVFQVILGQLGSTQGLAAMTLAVQQNIQGTFTNGRLAITYTAQTQFGTVASTVTSANLG
jgi:hypothetical protein